MGIGRVVVSELSLPKSARRTNVGPYDSAGDIPGGSPGITPSQLLRGLTNNGLKVAQAGIIPPLLSIIHSLVSTAHQGINIRAVIGVDGNSDTGADRNFMAIHDIRLSEDILNRSRNGDDILHPLYIDQ